MDLSSLPYNAAACTSMLIYTDTAVLVAVGCAFFLVWSLYLRPRLEQKKPIDSLPMPPDAHWLFGHLFWLLQTNFPDKQQTLSEYSNDKGRITMWLGPTIPSVCLTHWKDAQALLRNHHNREASSFIFRHHIEWFAGEKNLLLLNGKEWKHHQSVLKSSLRRLEGSGQLHSIVQQTTSTLVERIKTSILASNNISSSNISNSKTLPKHRIGDLMKMITIDVFGLAAFSHDFNSCHTMTSSPFAKAFEHMSSDVMDRFHRKAFLPQNLFYWIPTERNCQFNEKRRLIRSFLADIVRNRRDSSDRKQQQQQQQQQQNNNNHNDLLDKFIQAHAEAKERSGIVLQGESISNEDLIDALVSVLLAGYDTVSDTLTYALFLISRHPEWEAVCLEEIDSLTDTPTATAATTTGTGTATTETQSTDCSNNLHFHDERDLTFCRAVIYETLRLYPVAPATGRSLEKPLHLDDGGLIIPKGFHVGVSFWLIHRSEQFFPRPLEFRPDRWVKRQPGTNRWVERGGAEETSREVLPSLSSIIAAGNPDAFFPFSGGARSCPGQRFALQEATLAFAGLIKELKFHIDPDYELHLEWKGILQKPKDGIPATISIRTD